MNRWAASYRRSFVRIARRVALVRGRANQPDQRLEQVRVRFRDVRPEEIAGGISVAARHIMILAEDVPAEWLPLRQTDMVEVDGRQMVFTQRPDDQTHRDRDLLLAITGFVA